jgi:hypothetical protein
MVQTHVVDVAGEETGKIVVLQSADGQPGQGFVEPRRKRLGPALILSKRLGPKRLGPALILSFNEGEKVRTSGTA